MSSVGIKDFGLLGLWIISDYLGVIKLIGGLFDYWTAVVAAW